MPFSIELLHASTGRKWDVQVSEACSFGELKRAMAKLIGVPREGFNLSFRGRPKHDDDFLVDAGVGPGSKIAATETAEWRRSRGADAALARAEEQAAEAARRQPPASHPISALSPETNTNSNAAAAHPAPVPSSSSSSDPIARQLDALEATISTLEGDAAAAGLFTPSFAAPSRSSEQQQQPHRTTSTRGLFSRHRQQQEPAAAAAAAPHNSAALFKEALRIAEYSTQQLLKLDAVELPHVVEDGGGEGAGGVGGRVSDSNSTATALARERASALRSRRKALIKRAQVLGDAMDRAKERLK